MVAMLSVSSKRVKIAAIIFIVVFVGVGLGLSLFVNDFLATSFEEKDLPPIPKYQVAERSHPLPIKGNIASIAVPSGSQTDDHYNRSASLLQGAIMNQTAYQFMEAELAIQQQVTDSLPAWVARGLVIVIIIMFVLGMGPVQQRMPNYPGKPIARLLWLATFSPWRIQEQGTDFLRQGFPILIWVFSVILLGVGALTFFMAPLLLLTLFQIILFVVVMLLVFFVANRINEKGSYMMAALAPMTLLIAVLMVLGVIQGFSFFFYLFWVNPSVQILLISIGLLIIGWQLFTIIVISMKSLEFSLVSSLGRLLIVLGFLFMMIGVFIGSIGLETIITTLIPEFVFLPFGLSEILGIVTNLNIPTFLSWYITIAGADLLIIGVVLWGIDYLWRRRQQQEPTEAPKTES